MPLHAFSLSISMKRMPVMSGKNLVLINISATTIIAWYIYYVNQTFRWLPHSPGTEIGGKAYIRSHRSIEERISAAKKFVKDLNFPIDLVCDSFDNQVYTYYQCSPERLYIVQDGVIVYQGGVGPFDYKLAEVKDWLGERFGLRGDSITRR